MHPVFFQMGGIVGYSYGLMIGIGALLAIFVSEWRAKRRGLDGELVFSAAVWGLLAGLLGAKLTFIISNIKLLFTNPHEPELCARHKRVHGLRRCRARHHRRRAHREAQESRRAGLPGPRHSADRAGTGLWTHRLLPRRLLLR